LFHFLIGAIEKIVLCLFLRLQSFPTLFTPSSKERKKNNTPTPIAIEKDVAKLAVVKKATLDTEESFKFFGNQLLFQVKKRLNLNTKEEEKKQSMSSSNKKFSFFGIEVERD
tara:strand:+ start:31909 stop:32244 length:336 start_codon:yes stop_codon:yes gene_type:complete